MDFNFASVIISAVIAAAVIAAVVYLKKNKVKGCTMCNGDCEHCGKR